MKGRNNNKTKSFFSTYNFKSYNKGEVIVKAEDKIDNAFYLQKGFVREYTNSNDGGELTLHIFVPGSFFPMTSVISGIANRYYYEALTNVKAYPVPKAKVFDFLKKEPAVLLDLTDRLLQGIDRLLTRIEYLTFAKADTRVVSSLLFLASHFARKSGKKIEIKYRFTHKDIASIAGVTRETASRTLEDLKRSKVIEFKHSKIIINNLKALQTRV